MNYTLENLLTDQSTVTENRNEYLLRMGRATPRFLQGVFPCLGYGIYELVPLNESLAYTVPPDCAARVLYFRAGNPSEDLIYLTLDINGQPVRYFPVGPKSDLHVPLAIVETYPAGTHVEVRFAAPRGLSGSVIVDVGLIEEPLEPGA